MQSTTMRDKAVALARSGFRVFPLRAGAKKPPLVPANKPKPPRKQYFDLIPSYDPVEVAAMWTGADGSPLQHNIGICTNDMLVFDVDNKGEKRGDGSLSELVMEKGLDLHTLETHTPTDGRHLFYSLPHGVVVDGSVESIAPGIDVRGWHGYVVAPGSIVPEGEYQWARGPDVASMAPAPSSILNTLIRSDRQHKDVKLPEGLELDRPEEIDRARLWLINGAPEAIEGAGQNQATYRVAARVKDLAISEDMCLELLAEHWNPEKAHPPLPIGKLEEIVGNAYAYGTEPIGVASAQAQFQPVDLGGARDSLSQVPVAKKPRLIVRSFDESRGRALRDDFKPLIAGYLERGAMSVLYGDSGAGKTFVALDMAYHVAASLEWNGRKTVGGPVLYVAAEAGESVNARIAALHEHYKPKTPPPLGVVPCLVNLFTPGADLKELTEVALGWADKCGAPLAHMTLDTLARVIGPGDENSARDMGILVQNIDRMRVATGAHQMLVHHSGKNKANGARGSSALRAATDTELEVEGGKIKMRKQRSAEEAKPIAFRLRQIVIGENENGSVTSCVVDKGATVDFEPQMTPLQQDRITKLRDYIKSKGLAVFTHKEIGEAWAQPEIGIIGGEGDCRSLPEKLSERAIRESAEELERSAVIKKVSKDGEKPKAYKISAEAAERSAVDSQSRV